MLNVFDCKDYIDFSVLVDSGVLVALYNRYHGQVVEFWGSCPSQLVTTLGWGIKPNRDESFVGPPVTNSTYDIIGYISGRIRGRLW